MPASLPVLTVAHAAAWSAWLRQNAKDSVGVWLTLAKKGTTSPTSLTYPQALDESLCYGWIDGQKRKLDDKTFAQRFTPRTAKSSWSQINVGHVARLEKEGRMTALGRKVVTAAKADGRWDAAYAGQATAEAPPDFLAAVAAVPTAQAMWEALTRQNRFAIYIRLTSLKTQSGRDQKIAAFVEMLARGEMPHMQKQPAKQMVAASKEASQRSKKSLVLTASKKTKVGSKATCAKVAKAATKKRAT